MTTLDLEQYWKNRRRILVGELDVLMQTAQTIAGAGVQLKMVTDKINDTKRELIICDNVSLALANRIKFETKVAESIGFLQKEKGPAVSDEAPFRNNMKSP